MTEPETATSDPLLFWARLPLGTTLWLRERFRAYRETPGASSAPDEWDTEKGERR